MQAPVHQDIPRYDLWLKVILWGVPVALATGGVVRLSMEARGAYWVLAEALFIALVFKAVMPTRYLVYPDRVRIALGGPLGMNIPFSRIRRVRRGTAGLTPTINFVTSARGTIQIDRMGAMSVVISPSRPDFFLEQLALYLGKDRIDQDHLPFLKGD